MGPEPRNPGSYATRPVIFRSRYKFTGYSDRYTILHILRQYSCHTRKKVAIFALQTGLQQVAFTVEFVLWLEIRWWNGRGMYSRKPTLMILDVCQERSEKTCSHRIWYTQRHDLSGENNNSYEIIK